ncbi:MAG: MlaC/ttg2D family ABC transporter substrate-binding protein [Gammaproteobacteria bacterium]|jgi:phospholipid transport system substrate-binding protein
MAQYAMMGEPRAITLHRYRVHTGQKGEISMKETSPLVRAFFIAVCVCLSAGGNAAEANERPIVIVKDTIGRILQTLNDPQFTEDERRDRVAAIASERINYYEMGRRILAVNWSKTEPADQRRFVELFRQVLTNAYWSRIKKYRNEEVVYFTSNSDGVNFATVDTVIQSDTVEIPVTYRLKHTDGKWLAYDFLVEGQSLVATYRDSCAETIKNHGMARLLEDMEKRIAEPA